MTTVYLSPVFNGWQGFSIAGIPLAGGLLNTYLAGTSTPAATYTDNTGATPNANPIQLDAAGLPPNEVWLASGVAYKFVLTDALGLNARTYDNVSGVDTGGGVSTLTAALAASSGSSLIGYIESGTGAGARTVQAKLREMVSVTDYGGVMNNSAGSVRTANSAALLNALSGGRSVTIPAGIFWIDPSTALSGFWHIVGAGSASTFIKGDGDLFSLAAADNGEMRLIQHLTIINDVTSGKLFKNVGTTNRVEFENVNFDKANYHVYSSGGDAVSWKFGNCRFIGASVESRHFEGLWVYSEVSCYTWFCTIGLRCTNGNVSTGSIVGSTFEQMDSSGIVLDASDPSFEVDGFHIFGTHFEVNGKLTNLADVQILTSAATRLRNVSMIGCGFFSPTGTQTVRVSVTAGGGGNIDLINIENSCLMGAVALCSSVSAVKARNIYFQSLSMPTGVTVPVTIPQSFAGKYLGSESVTGASAGSSAVVATGSVLPGATRMAMISVQGNIYNGVANTHTGYLESRYFVSGSRFAALTDVNNSAGSNQGFVASLVGGAIQIANKAAMTNNQSGDVVISYWG